MLGVAGEVVCEVDEQTYRRFVTDGDDLVHPVGDPVERIGLDTVTADRARGQAIVLGGLGPGVEQGATRRP